MRMLVVRLAATLAAALVVGAVTARAGEEDEGPRVGAAVGYSSLFARPFVAIDFLVPIGPSFAVVPNASYVETGGVHRWTLGTEFQWNAPAWKLHRKLLAWTGAGLSLVTEDPRGPLDATTRDLVANAVVGVGYDAPATPFIQMRIALKDPTDVGLSVGVRF